MNCKKLVFFVLFFAAIGLLWGYTAYAGPGHVIGPVGAAEPVGQCDGTDNDTDGFIDDGFHDADMAFGGGDGVADCIDTGDADGDGLPDDVENPTGLWPPAYTNPEDSDTDDDGLLDGAEDLNADSIVDPDECDPNVANTDANGPVDGAPNEGTGDADGDLTANCQETDNDNDGLLDNQEDLNANGTLQPNECNPNNANTDGVSANDGVGSETTTDTDGDGTANCQDTNNDNDFLTDGVEDINANGNYDAGGECNLVDRDSDSTAIEAEDGENGNEGIGNIDGDGLLDCEDPNNDNDAYTDSQEDLNDNATYELANDDCNMNAINTDNVSGDDGEGNETAALNSDSVVSDGTNCEDPNNDNDVLTDDLEDINNDGVYEGIAVGGDNCNLIVANTDGVSGVDSNATNESTGDADGDGLMNCEDTDNDNDGGDGQGNIGNDTAEDDNGNGITDGLECNMNVANSDGQSALDYVGNEGEADQPAPDVDTIRNCQDPDNDGDGLLDGAEDVNNNGVFDGPVNGSNECNLIVVNTDAVNGNDNDPIETMIDTDGDGRPNCNDTDNDNDGINDTQDPTPNVAFDCNQAIKMQYLTTNVKFTAPNQLKTLKVKITRNIVGKNVRLDSIDPTVASPDIVDVTNVSPSLPRTITSSTTFTITVKGPAAGPFPVTVPFPTAQFTPNFPGAVGDGQGADRLDYTFSCGTYIALSKPERLELHDLQAQVSNGQLKFEVLGQGVKGLSVQLYDISGLALFQAEATGRALSMPLAGQYRLSNGVYLYVVTVKGYDGKVIKSEVRKLVIKQ